MQKGNPKKAGQECVNSSKKATKEKLENWVELDPDRLITLSDGYCFDILFIAEYMIDNSKKTENPFVNPITKKIFTNKDFELVYNKIYQRLSSDKSSVSSVEKKFKKSILNYAYEKIEYPNLKNLTEKEKNLFLFIINFLE